MVRDAGDLFALHALDAAREAAFRRGDVRTRRPAAAPRYLAASGAGAPGESGTADRIGDPVASPGPGWGDVGSGARPSWRDPHPVGELLARTIRDRGWQSHLDIASVSARWDAIVGPNVARHCRIEDFSDDGVLTLRASSTSWKTQMRALLATLSGRIAAEIGEGIVKEIVILGPHRPSWKHGPLSVPGRGPRDTYG
ncbi:MULTISPECIES: DUF721 domain-containing protein [Actinotignum]|uniref:DciA family protein n=3 Tax=Actinotignum timonense TaxID=1870995 RepID=A0AAW9HDM7_9ACTO|nr:MULTISPECIES: DciA family protein [Actinotignum]MBS5748050.1 DUF721 domain-containing protein [Actinotignum schaalii]MDE1558765.1 DciA family protein [Actinotignum schaalii]MDE1663681.1 DciA family protein [Actinotignum schaalii]MDK6374023.1 DciA family protein [Actinotignum timonense]MDK6419894.1 DciA family protein [Actinotignum timonense]